MHIQKNGSVFQIKKIIGQFLFGRVGAGGVAKTYLGPTAEPRFKKMPAGPKGNFFI